MDYRFLRGLNKRTAFNTILSFSSSRSFTVQKDGYYVIVAKVTRQEVVTFTGVSVNMLVNPTDTTYVLEGSGAIRTFVLKANGNGTLTINADIFFEQSVYEFL